MKEVAKYNWKQPEGWMNYASIDWQRIARACKFYEERGFEYIETPWVVDWSTIEVTLPSGQYAFSFEEDTTLGLIGSAEQGFVSLMIDPKYAHKFVPEKNFYSVSPCFRGESNLEVGMRQFAFMKVELFRVLDQRFHKPMSHKYFEYQAKQFMLDEKAQVRAEETEFGSDLTCNGIEVGSYGTRDTLIITNSEFGRRQIPYRWDYGTGLAEPRFSTALMKT